MRRLLNTRTLAVTAAAFVLSGVWAGIAQASDPLGYVTNEGAGTVSQVDLATGAVGTPISVGSQPVAIAITPDGSTAYIADYGSSQIVPVALASGRVGPPVILSDHPNAIAITPDGRTAYVISDNGREWPITLATGHIGNPTRIPANSDAITIAPAGGTAYIANVADGTLTPFTLSNNTIGQPINLSSPTPDAVAITPDGTTAYIASNNAGTITPLNLASSTSGTSISLGSGTQPTSVAISSDGSTAYVTEFGTGQVTPVTLSGGIVGTAIAVGAQPSAIGLVPAGGITTAPPPSGAGSSGASGGGSHTSTLGNQQLTLEVTPTPVTSSTSTQACYAASSTLTFKLRRRTLSHAAKLKFHYVTFTLGKQVKRSKRLPATVRFSLHGLSPGAHTLSVRAFFTESLSRAGKRSGHKLTVTLRKTLKTPFSVC
ncbi:MAG TPA: YncE family protein [Solirubrobacteraceae bacterium]|nr:YncE family protein [Solirubrobacteraceae bacterium]